MATLFRQNSEDMMLSGHVLYSQQ